MSECNLNTLDQSSKTGLLAIAIIAVLGSGFVGGLIGYVIFRRPDTVLNVTVDEGFYIEYETITPLDSVDYNCTGVVVAGEMFSNDFYDDIINYLAKNESNVFDEDTILEDTGRDYLQMGLHVEFIGDEDFFTIPTPDSNLDGQSFPVSFGENAVLLYLTISAYDGEGTLDYTFTFNGTNALENALNAGIANHTTFQEGDVLRGINNMKIHGMTIVEEESPMLEMETVLNVTFNGHDILMPLSGSGML